MNDKIVIRKAVENDCNEIAIVKYKVWQTTYRGIYYDEKLDNYDFKAQEIKFKEILKNSNINFYVAVLDEKILGYMTEGKTCRPFADYEQEIGLLYILKEYQGNGIGKAFFDIAYNSIKSRGYKKFYISCNKYNTNSQKFYEKMGGKIVFADEDKEDKSESQVKFHYDII